MNEWAKEIGEMSALFALSAFVAYFYTFFTKSKPISGPPLRSRLRVRLPGGMARGALLAKGPFGWEIGPVLQRHGSAKAMIGDSIIVEAPIRNGVTLFRSTITSFEGTTLTIEPPQRVFSKNRREHFRRTDLEGWEVSLDGGAACIVDLSTHGARLSQLENVEKSQRVEVVIGKLVLPSWVLEVCSDHSARVMFEEPLDVSVLKMKTAPSC